MPQVQRFSGNLYTSPDGKVFPHPQTLPSSPQTSLHLSHTALPGVPEVQTGCNVSSSSALALPSLWHDAYDSSGCPLTWGMDRVLIFVSLTAPSRQEVRIQPAVKEGSVRPSVCLSLLVLGGRASAGNVETGRQVVPESQRTTQQWQQVPVSSPRPSATQVWGVL